MSGFHDNALIGASGSQGYQISRSVRLRSSASAYFNRTPASAGSRRTWTWSGWVKRGALGGDQVLMYAGFSADYNNTIRFNSDNTIYVFRYDTPSITWGISTTPVYRDPSGWYHIVVSFDSTQATAANRVRLFVNGTQINTFTSSSYPAQNADNDINNTVVHRLGNNAASNHFDGYLTEVNFIDGQALTPSSFGVTNAYGVWSPTKYTGTYGTNGFYLNFSDNSAATAAAIGKDYSGNGNNWTPNNISVTAGATYDSMLDVPTQWADGGNGRGNYATLNPLILIPRGTISNGNLNYLSGSTASHGSAAASFTLPTTGKWYWEVTACANSGGSGNNEAIGVANIQNNPQLPASSSEIGSRSGDYAYRSNATRVSGGSSVSYGATYTNGDVIGVAWDSDAGTLVFYKNGSSQGTAYSSITQEAGKYAPASSNAESSNGDTFNFGQRAFAYTPPSGFKALNTLNLPTPTILKGNQYFDVVLYTGNAVQDRAVTGFGFDLDLAWIKSRNNAGSHVLVNREVGGDKQLFSNLTNAEQTNSDVTNGFTTGGILVGDNLTGTGSTNQNTYTYALWGWKEGATQGFDIVTYTGTGSATTVAHSLGVAPAMIIAKGRGGTSTSWWVYHKSLGTPVLEMNSTAASATYVSVFNNTAPTSSVFSVGTGDTNRSGQTQLAYLFAEVAGFSKFGSYTGNGSSDGVFVHLGFRARYLLIKETGNANSWEVYDTARNSANVQTQRLFPNDSLAEATTDPSLDILSNGFKCRAGNTGINRSGGTYIYAAFAENPFKHSLAR